MSLAPMDGKALQQAKREAAERFYAIGMSYLPPKWTFAFRKSLSGRAFLSTKHIDAPKPVTRKALYIWLHECAHAHLHGGKQRPRHVEELEAELWAHRIMREHGIPVPKAMTRVAKRNVAKKIRQALTHGAKTIDPAALKYAKAKS